MQIVELKWNDVESLVDNLAKQIIDRKTPVDGLISIGRGGMIPSRMLSDLLSVEDIYYIPYASYERFERRQGTKTLLFPYRLTGQTYLLVDEILQTGKTLMEVKTFFDNKPQRFLTAILQKRKSCDIVPTFLGETVNHNKWIKYPWERNEF